MPRCVFIAFLCVLLPETADADDDRPLTIAVASNFASAAEEVVAEFTSVTGIPARLSTGSTGKLFAQITNGAPYDVFLSADETRPVLLEELGFAVAGSRTTYALGSLVLWSADESLRGQDCRAVLEDGGFNHIAIANPATAPYGLAAKEFLMSTNLWSDVSRHIVFGENISQTLQFVVTGNAAIGLVATSQVSGDLERQSTCHWSVPSSLHSEISQQAVAIFASRNRRESMRFLEFLSGPEAIAVLRRRGYGVPE